MIKVFDDNNIKIIFPQNDIIKDHSDELLKIFDELIKNGSINFTINFSNVKNIDSKGICTLIILNKIIHKRGKIKIINMNDKLKKLFSIIKNSWNLED